MKPIPEKPKAGQESVWDYPRPPRLEATTKTIRVVFAGKDIITTNNALRMLETSHPPTYYLPMAEVEQQYLRPSGKTSFCEFKGQAQYFDVVVGEKVAPQAAWYYADPSKKYPNLEGHIAFYAHLMDACYVNEEAVKPQEGGFYGGWITSDLAGPFKGIPGSWGW
ncbi:MAG: DUF427 domain-containing protein [Bernardetiaceae bacterium]|nr:DUF427 domain-containing protein [Bernardetiaceae bacterium]